mmetsp:Transcript_28773/g.38234  ORF Transcript_28773/g.38234 Transcript_28773/m.38234 type:complete len:143 (+) Transcript_28773:69-497(+)
MSFINNDKTSFEREANCISRWFGQKSIVRKYNYFSSCKRFLVLHFELKRSSKSIRYIKDNPQIYQKWCEKPSTIRDFQSTCKALYGHDIVIVKRNIILCVPILFTTSLATKLGIALGQPQGGRVIQQKTVNKNREQQNNLIT